MTTARTQKSLAARAGRRRADSDVPRRVAECAHAVLRPNGRPATPVAHRTGFFARPFGDSMVCRHGLLGAGRPKRLGRRRISTGGRSEQLGAAISRQQPGSRRPVGSVAVCDARRTSHGDRFDGSGALGGTGDMLWQTDPYGRYSSRTDTRAAPSRATVRSERIAGPFITLGRAASG